jgi:hypothetical protein
MGSHVCRLFKAYKPWTLEKVLKFFRFQPMK